jgi:hypothetical protein
VISEQAFGLTLDNRLLVADVTAGRPLESAELMGLAASVTALYISVALESRTRWLSPVSQLASRHSDDPSVSIQLFHDSCQRKEKLEHLDLTLGKSVQGKDRPLL